MKVVMGSVTPRREVEVVMKRGSSEIKGTRKLGSQPFSLWRSQAPGQDSDLEMDEAQVRKMGGYLESEPRRTMTSISHLFVLW